MARKRKFSTEELFRAAKQLLLQHGYEGFTISLLAERLDVSRGLVYKYFENKEELLTAYMMFEMDIFLRELKKVELERGFQAQFNFILNLIFENTEIHQIVGMGQSISTNLTSKARENKKRLDQQHFEMYKRLQGVINLGKEEQKLKSHLPDSVILGFIFQSIAIPNHFGIPESQWFSSLKEVLKVGMFTESN